MPLPVPKIDDRNFRQILAEALARIPVHNPEWTNFNDSDPGVTLLQLFAFMSENLLYRCNQVPERNRKKFLQLLGLNLQPATAAECLVVFMNERGPIDAVTLPAGMELQAGKVPFRTTRGLDVLPVAAQIFYKKPISAERLARLQQAAPEAFAIEPAEATPRFYETASMPLPANNAALPELDLAQDTLDGSLWIALLARSEALVEQTRAALANKTLSLGILPALATTPRVLRPGGPVSDENQTVLRFLRPDAPPGGLLGPEPETRVARYRELDSRTETPILEKPGIVEIKLPAAESLQTWQNLEPGEAGTGDFPPPIEDTNIASRLVTWIRIQLPDAQAGAEMPAHMHVRLSWIGINAAPVVQQAFVPLEVLGKGTGEPDQVFQLANTPVIVEPADRVQILVDGEPWSMIDDLFAAGPEEDTLAAAQAGSERPVRVFQIDPQSGEVRFGDGAHGARPPRGAVIQARYYYGGGREGMVGIGAINKAASLPPGLKLANQIPAWGGDEAETVAEAEKRIPAYLRERDIMVTAEGFKEVTLRTPGVDLGRVDVIPLFNPELPNALSPGVVTVMVIPKYDPLQPETPMPDQLFLDTICDYLEPRRLLTTEVHVRGPEYHDIFVSIGIEVVPGNAFAPVREAVAAHIREYLSPLKGGREKAGWPRNKNVLALELLAEAARVPGVAYVRQVRLADAEHEDAQEIPLENLQLPRLTAISVGLGDARPLLEAAAGLPPAPSVKISPVPVYPEECT